jgi:Tol biopolymer transport system component
MRSLVIMGFVGLAYTALVWGLLAGGCCENPKGPGECPPDTCEPVDSVDTAGSPPTVDTFDFPDECPPLPARDTLNCPPGPGHCLDVVSDELLNNPVYSPIDNCVYYEDTGMDSTYFTDFIHSVGDVWNPPVVQPGIYRLRLDDDSPAELVAPWGRSPSITPDRTTLYYIYGYSEGFGIGVPWGRIMKKQLPDGESEFVSNLSGYRACWYSPDTLVVSQPAIKFWDIRTDSLHLHGVYLYDFDVLPDKRIIGNGLMIYNPRDSSFEAITNTGGGCGQCRCSPDGSEIVYDYGDGTGSQIRVTDLAGNQRILAIGGAISGRPDYPCLGLVREPDFAIDGKYVIYIKTTTPVRHGYLYPCGIGDNPVFDGQIWIMSALDGSGKRQVSTWSRIRP